VAGGLQRCYVIYEIGSFVFVVVREMAVLVGGFWRVCVLFFKLFFSRLILCVRRKAVGIVLNLHKMFLGFLGFALKESLPA